MLHCFSFFQIALLPQQQAAWLIKYFVFLVQQQPDFVFGCAHLKRCAMQQALQIGTVFSPLLSYSTNMYRQKQAPPQETRVALRTFIHNTGSPALPARYAQEPTTRLKGDPASMGAAAYQAPSFVFERHMHNLEQDALL